MNSYRRTEIVTTRVEYAMPSGSAIGEIGKLEATVWHEYCRLNGKDPNTETRWDDWCRMEARDDEVVFVFAVDKEVKTDA